MRFVSLVCLVFGCGGEKISIGGQCNLTSECDTPLVCRIGHCRSECATSRDCPVGAQCLVSEGIGSCQLVEERTCDLDSECTLPLVCRERGCVSRCEEDRDCPPGARCIERDGTACAGADCTCEDPAAFACTLASDCRVEDPSGALTCGLDARCRLRCRSDRDCLFGGTCEETSGVCAPPDGGYRFPDAGAPPDGATDAGSDAGDRPGCLMDSATALGLGFVFSCAVVGGGEVACWGSDQSGGMSTPFPFPYDGRHRRRPELVPGVLDAVDIAAGSGHACIRHRGGGVSCFGKNELGQLGDGTTTDRLIDPVLVDGLSGAVAIDAGGDRTCALLETGSFVCWGAAANGQLGDGRTAAGAIATTPVTVTTPGSVASFSLTGSGGCVIDPEGELACWGANSAGEAGVGSTLVTPVPTLLTTSFTAVQFAGGNRDACARDDSDALWCWGARAASTVPARFGTVVAEDMALGDGGCIIQSDRTVACWGSLRGDGMMMDRPEPSTPALDLAGVDEVEVGFTHVCARAGGAVYCFGLNNFGQLGDGTEIPYLVPVRTACEL
jgi:hypothetical protein